jgi:hypothetical protein
VVNESGAGETTFTILNQDKSTSSHHSICVVKHPCSDYVNDTDMLDDEQKVELIVVCDKTAFDILLMFENFPVWLLGLEPSRTCNIHILGFATQQGLMEYLAD